MEAAAAFAARCYPITLMQTCVALSQLRPPQQPEPPQVSPACRQRLGGGWHLLPVHTPEQHSLPAEQLSLSKRQALGAQYAEMFFDESV